MDIDFLKKVFQEHADDDAFQWRDSGYSYRWLLDQIERDHVRLDAAGVKAGSVVALHGESSPDSVAAMLCLIERDAVIVPVAPSSESHASEMNAIAEIELEARLNISTGRPGATSRERISDLRVTPTATRASHPLYRQLAAGGGAGLVFFSSGSTGAPKGVVHDLSRLLAKYSRRRHCYRTLAFLLFDHIGGFDTVFYSLSNGSCLILCEDRSPDGVCELVQRHQVDVLPVAPSFLNLLFLNGAYRRHDLSSLKIVTYGAEVMPQTTLDRCAEMFPGVTMMQKFGASEVGTLRSKSKTSDSLWVKLGGEGYETRVVDGLLEIKAESSMLGYLNAESPFTEDGWFKTGDCVDVDGEYIRFQGRDSDLINVGGQKVHPAEVEAVIGALENIEAVAVFGEANALMGQVVCARVVTVAPEEQKALYRRVRLACKSALEGYKVPVKVEISDVPITSDRFKVRRRN